MNAPARFQIQPRHLWLTALYLAAAVIGWTVAYGFGARTGGMWMGVLAGANGAVFATLLVDAIAGRVMGRRRAPQR